VGTVPPLTPEIWRLARTLADRAAGSASDILRLAIPPRMVRAEQQHLAATRATQATGSGDTSDEAAAELAAALVAGARFALSPRHAPQRLSTGEWVGSWAMQLADLALAVYELGRSVILVAPDYRDVDQLHDS